MGTRVCIISTRYAANAVLATKVSFINSIPTICDALGADIDDIEQTLASDRRIGVGHLISGPGWGRSLPAEGHLRSFANPLQRACDCH
ncbi:hypothetical protein [Nocardia alba]|uniref:hypothetical protein n=1 Tax=Nocardia alba TaxID=225051 RepID=UPI001404349D